MKKTRSSIDDRERAVAGVVEAGRARIQYPVFDNDRSFEIPGQVEVEGRGSLIAAWWEELLIAMEDLPTSVPDSDLDREARTGAAIELQYHAD